VQGTGPALLGAAAVKHGAEQLEDGGDGDGGLDGSEVDGRPRWSRRRRRVSDSGLTLGLVLGLAESGASFAGLGEFAIAGVMDLSILAIEFVLGCDVADGGVKPRRVVVVGVIGDDSSSVVEGEWNLDADAIAFECLVPAFDFAVALGIIRRGFDVRHTGGADELFEVLGDELGPVVGDDARSCVGVGFAGALEDGGDVGFLHLFADFVVDDESAIAVEDGAEEVEGAGDVEVADVDVPVLVGCQWLDESGAFFGGHGRRTGEEPGGFEDAVDAGGTAGDDVGVEHLEGESAIAFVGMGASVGADLLLFVIGEPVIAGDEGVVFVDLAEAVFPVVELAGGESDPLEEATSREFGLVAPVANEVDDGVAGVVGRPAGVQISPSSFFKRVWASRSSAMTSFLRASLASRRWIFSTLASSVAWDLRLLSKAA
jgi:hypothetical protein